MKQTTFRRDLPISSRRGSASFSVSRVGAPTSGRREPAWIRRILPLALVLLSFASTFLGATVTAVTPLTYHVATSGSDLNPGTESQPFKTIRKAVEVLRPGDTLLIHEGTYTGVIEIKRSGMPGAPITMRPAGDGPVTLRADLPRLACSEIAPTLTRTIRLLAGADYWTFQDLTIVGGVLVSGTNFNTLSPYLMDRSLPGRGQYNPDAAATTLGALGVDAGDHVRIVGNKISGRGIHAVAARYGEVLDNEIFDIECGTGPGVILARFSDGWTIRGNHIHHITGSDNHWMSEGIRIVAASMYNLVDDNLVEDIGGFGRGVTADVNAGWNIIRGNTVKRAAHGFSLQVGGWGNQWIDNVAEGNRQYGFNILGMDFAATRPGVRTPSFLQVKCNRASGNYIDLFMGTVQESAFTSNSFGSIKLGKYLRNYWGSVGNLWDGAPVPPSESTPVRSCPTIKPYLLDDPARFVIQQYRDWFDRDPDPARVTEWAAEIEAGDLTQAGAINRLLHSDEFELGTLPVTRLYTAYFLTIPTYDEVLSLTARLRSGVPLSTFSEEFAASASFQDRYGSLSNSEFVSRMYADVLGREADVGGHGYWTGLLDQGVARPYVMVAVAASPEYTRRSFSWVHVTHMFVNMLRRAPDSGGFQAWVGFLEGGNSVVNMIDQFLVSGEYRNRFTSP